MIDKIIYTIFGTLDKWSEWIDSFFIKPKKTKKKKKCKLCKCECHCIDDLHNSWIDGDICACEGCKH